MISIEDVKHLALLARLELSEGELVRCRDDLVKILEYVGELQGVETAGVEPHHQSPTLLLQPQRIALGRHHVLGLTSVLRNDEERILRDERLAAKLLVMAPKQKDGFVVVPRILYHE